MPIEYVLLESKPVPLDACPNCGARPFVPFMRGQVQRSKRRWLFGLAGPKRPYCALICWSCKQIVAYESPLSDHLEVAEKLRRLYRRLGD